MSTGHAESVRITYDPTQVTYGRLLQIYFSVVTDPTQLNRQGPDVGTQYRSAIFAQNADQQRIAQAYIAQLSQAAVFPAPIVTRVEPNTGFFPAEAYHQNYLDSHPTSAYIVMNDMPKVDDLAAPVSAAVSRSAGAGVGGLIQFRLGFARDAVPFGRQVQPAVPGPAVFIVVSCRRTRGGSVSANPRETSSMRRSGRRQRSGHR